MTFDKAVNEVKDTLETVGERSQDAAKVSLKTLKAANEIVISGVQDVVETQTTAAKDLFAAGKHSFDKAVSAGLVAVVSSPIEYLPEGKDTIVGAFNDTVSTVTKTGEKLVKVVKNGAEDVVATLQGKAPKARAKKAVRKASNAAAQAAA